MFFPFLEVPEFVNTDCIVGNKFLRRPELTAFDRLQIVFEAYSAKLFGLWGTITALSRHFKISRTFIYDQLAVFEEVVEQLLGPSANPADQDIKKNAVEVMASLRLEGKCSIGSIVTIMKRLGLRFSSQGTVSTYLNQLGSLAPSTLNVENERQPVVFLSDEIFSNRQPILITVDPISSAILKIELADKRRAKEWKKHWLCIENNGFDAIYLVTDEGTGLCAAYDEVFSGVMRQPDTFHAIAHRLGLWIERLEKSAYKAITEEYDRKKKIGSARTDKVIVKRTKQYELARSNAQKAVEVYDSFSFLYHCIITELKPFHSNGVLRGRKQAEDNIYAGFELIKALGNSKINKTVEQIMRIVPTLLNYFDIACEVVAKLDKLPIDQNTLSSLCLAWQWHKAKIKAKKADRRNRCANKEEFCLDVAEGYIQEDFEIIKERIYTELDTIVQSSALVECINSIIRPYLNNSKGQVNQEALNLMMFYHNHRRYTAGKRAKKTPVEILTGKQQNKDWLQLLFELADEKEPQFFSAAA